MLARVVLEDALAAEAGLRVLAHRSRGVGLGAAARAAGRRAGRRCRSRRRRCARRDTGAPRGRGRPCSAPRSGRGSPVEPNFMPARKRTFGDVGQRVDRRGVEEVARGDGDHRPPRATSATTVLEKRETAMTRRGTPAASAARLTRRASDGPHLPARAEDHHVAGQPGEELHVGGRGPGEQLLELRPRRARLPARRGARGSWVIVARERRRRGARPARGGAGATPPGSRLERRSYADAEDPARARSPPRCRSSRRPGPR